MIAEPLSIPADPGVVTTLGQLASWLDRRCLIAAAVAKDNVGLIAGDPEQEIARVTLCLDLRASVLSRHGGGELLLCYHPPIYQPISRVVASTAKSPSTTGVLFEALRRGVALYSPHTGLDVATGGTSDTMGERLGLTELEPLRAVVQPAREVKLQVFCPPSATERIRAAVCDAGGGLIGNYSQCAFRTTGRGSFLGNERSRPTTGSAGQLEFVDEDKLDVLVPTQRLGQVLTALRTAHPYEEPAYDLVALTDAHLGIGRVGRLESPMDPAAFIRHVAEAFGVLAVRAAGRTDEPIETVAVTPGSGSSAVDDVLRSGVQAVVTGELSHHDGRTLADAGVLAVCVGHGISERPVLDKLAGWIQREFPHVTAVVDDQDAEPWEAVSLDVM